MAMRTDVVSRSAASPSASEAAQASSAAAKSRIAVAGGASARADGVRAIEPREASRTSLAIVTGRLRFSVRRGPELLLAAALARALEPELDFERKPAGDVHGRVGAEHHAHEHREREVVDDLAAQDVESHDREEHGERGDDGPAQGLV